MSYFRDTAMSKSSSVGVMTPCTLQNAACCSIHRAPVTTPAHNGRHTAALQHRTQSSELLADNARASRLDTLVNTMSWRGIASCSFLHVAIDQKYK